MFHLFKINILRTQVSLTLQSMEKDKRPNIEYHEKQAATLAITTVKLAINRFLIRNVSSESVHN